MLRHGSRPEGAVCFLSHICCNTWRVIEGEHFDLNVLVLTYMYRLRPKKYILLQEAMDDVLDVFGAEVARLCSKVK